MDCVLHSTPIPIPFPRGFSKNGVILKCAGITGQTTGGFRTEMGLRAAITCPVVVVKDDGTVVQQLDGDGDSDTMGH